LAGGGKRAGQPAFFAAARRFRGVKVIPTKPVILSAAKDLIKAEQFAVNQTAQA
jgi:hypothetical protein